MRWQHTSTILDLEGWGLSVLGWLLTPLLRYALHLENRGFKWRAEAP